MFARFLYMSAALTAFYPAMSGLSADAELMELLKSAQDRRWLASMLKQYPELLERTKALVAMVQGSEHVGSVSIEVDDEDACVLVWGRLRVDEADRLVVKRRLFEEGERLVGDLADVVRLAMLWPAYSTRRFFSRWRSASGSLQPPRPSIGTAWAGPSMRRS